MLSHARFVPPHWFPGSSGLPGGPGLLDLPVFWSPRSPCCTPGPPGLLGPTAPVDDRKQLSSNLQIGSFKPSLPYGTYVDYIYVYMHIYIYTHATSATSTVNTIPTSCMYVCMYVSTLHVCTYAHINTIYIYTYIYVQSLTYLCIYV